MKNRVVIVTDFDGTLLTDDKKILDKDLEAIEKFRSLGGKFAIATGRTINGSRQYFDVLKPDYPSIFYNGSVVYDVCKDEILYEKNLSDKAVSIVERIMKKFPCAMTEILRVNEIYAFNINPSGRHQLDICCEDVPDIDYEDIPKTKWLKALFVANPEIVSKIDEYITDEDRKYADFVTSGVNYLEVLPKNSSKGTAVEFLKKKEDKTTEFVTIGDYNNDIEMLKAASFSAAPLNAEDDVKKAASIVLDKDNNNGAMNALVLNVIKKYFNV